MAALPFPVVLLLLLATLPFLCLIRAASRRRGSSDRLPPSPWALPLIGHLHHLAGALPHRAMRDLASRHGPLMLLRLGGLPVVVASSADAAREVMRTRDLDFATRHVTPTIRLVVPEGTEGIIFAPFGDAWRQMRKICTVELLSARRVQSFRPVREEEAGQLLRSVASTPPAQAVNLSELLSVYATDSSVRAIIGSRFRDRDTFLTILERGLKLFAKMSLPDLYPSSRLAMLVSRMPGRMQRHRQDVTRFLDAIVREHEESRVGADDEEDLLDVLLRIQRQGDLQFPLTTDIIKQLVGLGSVLLIVLMLRVAMLHGDHASCYGNHCYLLLALVPLLLLIFLRPQGKSLKEASARLPPGPWRLPVIGSLHHLLTKPLMHRAIADLARRCDAPVMYLQLGEVPAVVISSRDAAREVLKTHDAAFATRPMSLSIRATAHEGLGIAFAPYGERWRGLRKICSVELFSAARVRSLRAVREDEAARLVAAVAAAAPPGELVDVGARVAAFVADTVLRAVLGERFSRRDELLEVLEVGLNKIKPVMSIGDMFPSSKLLCAIGGTVRNARAFHRRITGLIDCAIEQHRERRGVNSIANKEDLMDVLLRIQKEGGLDFALDMGTIKAVIVVRPCCFLHMKFRFFNSSYYKF
ncbi:hypothetical protein EJB05_41677, partial [Eragrostis curvula]